MTNEWTSQEEEEMEEAVREAKGEEDYNKPELPEAPVSITIRGYYKGFSVLITKRKEAVDNDEATKIMRTIDGLVVKGFQPSWNTETNVKTNGHKPAAQTMVCSICGSPAELKSGVSKTGKAWKGVFCSVDKEHVKWI